MSSLTELLLTIALLGICFPPLINNWITLQHHAKHIITQCQDNSENRYLFTTIQQLLSSAHHTRLTSHTKITALDNQNSTLTLTYNTGKLQLKKGLASNVNLNNQLSITALSITQPDPTHIQLHITEKNSHTWVFTTTP